MVYNLLDGYFFRWCPLYSQNGTVTNPWRTHRPTVFAALLWTTEAPVLCSPSVPSCRRDGSMVRYGEHPSPTRPTMNIHELCDDWWLVRVWPRLFQAAGHPSLGPVQQLCGGSQCRCIVVRVAGAVQGPWCRGRTTFHSRTKRGKFQAAVFFKFQTFHVAFHDIPCFFFDGLKSKTRKPGSRSACQDSGDLGNLGLRVDDFVCKSGNHIDEEVVPASCVKRA